MDFKDVYLKLLCNTNYVLYNDLYNYVLNMSSKKRKIVENESILNDIVNILDLNDVSYIKQNYKENTLNKIVNNIYIRYARVSSFKQSDNNSSLNQLSIIHECLEKRNINFSNCYNLCETNSAYSKIPNKLKLIIETLKNVCICVSHVDRLSRNISLFRDSFAPFLKKNNIKILICGENGCYGSDYNFSNLHSYEYDVLNFLNKIIPFQIESCRKGCRIKEINNYMKQNNIPNRKIFGYDIIKTDKKHLIINKNEQKIIDIIVTLKNGGVSSKKANKTMQEIYNEYYKDKLYVPFNFYFNNDDISNNLNSDGISFEDIALLLNEYELPYNGSNNWTKYIVANLYKKYCNRLLDEFNTITIKDDI
jgi:hypothetical protein